MRRATVLLAGTAPTPTRLRVSRRAAQRPLPWRQRRKQPRLTARVLWPAVPPPASTGRATGPRCGLSSGRQLSGKPQPCVGMLSRCCPCASQDPTSRRAVRTHGGVARCARLCSRGAMKVVGRAERQGGEGIAAAVPRQCTRCPTHFSQLPSAWGGTFMSTGVAIITTLPR